MTQYALQLKTSKNEEWRFWDDLTYFDNLEAAKEYLQALIEQIQIDYAESSDPVDPSLYRVVQILPAWTPQNAPVVSINLPGRWPMLED